MTVSANSKRLVLFDIDGTLLLPKGVGRDSTRAAMLEVFGTASAIDLLNFGGKTDYYILTQLLAEHGYDEERIGQLMPAYMDALERHIRRLIPNYAVEVLPGAMEAVKQLRDDGRTVLGIVTGNTSVSAKVKLQAAGFDPEWFVVGAYGDEAVSRNELSRLALKRAAAYCGHEIVLGNVYVIGDTVWDIACARAIGGIAVAVRTGFETHEALAAAQPDHLLDDLTTLFEVVK